MFLNQAGDIYRTQDRSTVNHGLMQIRIVIDKGDNPIIRPMVQGIEQLATRFACTINNDAAGIRAGANLMPGARRQALCTVPPLLALMH